MATTTAKHILIGGGSGFIGKALTSKLSSKGHKVSLISRSKLSPPPGVSQVFTWDQIKKEGLPKCDAIVNIPGAGLMDKRWSEQRKKELLDSRLIPTQILVSAIQSSKEPPEVLISGSAIGIYPTNNSLSLDETYSGPPADNFSGKLCDDWEKEAKKLDVSGTRLVLIRTGIVLGPNGGALSQMITPFKLGVGGIIASGNQPFPWIHIEDEVGIMEYAINHKSMTGPYLAISPESIDTTNRVFTKAFGSVLNRPTIFPIPEFVAKIMFGEAYFNLTEGPKLYPQRTIESGYKYQFPRLKEALEDVVKHWK